MQPARRRRKVDVFSQAIEVVRCARFVRMQVQRRILSVYEAEYAKPCVDKERLVQRKGMTFHSSKFWHSRQLSRMADSPKSASLQHMQGSAESPARSRSNTAILYRACSTEFPTQSVEQQGDPAASANPGRLHLCKESQEETTPFGISSIRSQALAAPEHQHQLGLQQQLAQTS